MAMFGSRAPAPPQNAFATARAYQPTVRDRLANALSQSLGDGYQAQRFTENLLGSRGLGSTKMGAADFSPLGLALGGDEGGRKIAYGNALSGLADVALSAIPIPAAAKGAKGLIGSAARAASAAERGYTIRAYHGTNAVFDKFDPAKIGSATDPGHLGHGFYFSTDPRVIGNRNVGMPVYLKLERPLHIKMPDMRTDKRSLVPKDLGDHDGVILDYSPSGYDHQEIMVRNPDQIRSIFDRFDP